MKCRKYVKCLQTVHQGMWVDPEYFVSGSQQCIFVSVCVCVCVCWCVCVCERERERETVCVWVGVDVSVCNHIVGGWV